LRFIAPEAISSKQTITPAADVYSWAATAFELINGSQSELGLNGNGNGEVGETDFYGVMHSHSTRTMPNLKTLCPSIPDELSAIIRKAGSLDPEERYANFSSLLHDLNCAKDICGGILRGKRRENFSVGAVDRQARFEIPPGLFDREREYGMLDEAYHLVRTTGRSQVVSCEGPSGSGKSKLLEVWARTKEREVAGQRCLVGWAKVSAFTIPDRAHIQCLSIRWTNIL
jgi:serine/threonine protein kinase